MDHTTLAQWATLIGQLGFPIMVASYLMVRFDGLITTLISAEKDESVMLTELNHSIDRLSEAVNRINGRI